MSIWGYWKSRRTYSGTLVVLPDKVDICHGYASAKDIGQEKEFQICQLTSRIKPTPLKSSCTKQLQALCSTGGRTDAELFAPYRGKVDDDDIDPISVESAKRGSSTRACAKRATLWFRRGSDCFGLLATLGYAPR